MFKKFIKLLLASLFFFSVSSTTFAMDKLHFLIGGGAGGGWDGTARGTGEALTKAGMLKSYIPKKTRGKKILADAILWATKFNGCAVTPHEIEEIKEVLEKF